jgi:hypothetical protein
MACFDSGTVDTRLIRSVPEWAWLASLVLVSAGVRFALARQIAAPAVMVDELIYSELAKSLAAHGTLQIRGASAGASYGWVYPLLIAPSYRTFTSLPAAYDGVKAINAILMSLGAVPAYGIARRLVRPPLPLIAALLAVAIPSLVYTGAVLTENAFYPLFLCVIWALMRMVDRPTALGQLGVLALCGMAYETRQQALALVPAVLTVPLLIDRRRLARYAFLYVGAAAAIVIIVIVQVGRGHSPLDVLGAYAVVGRYHYAAGPIAKWMLWHVSELSLYVGVVPLAAFLVLASGWRRLTRTQRAFIAIVAAVGAWLVLEVAAFASLPAVDRVEERALFYLAPLLLIALLLWIELGQPRPRFRAASLTAVAALLVPVLPFSRLISPSMTSDTLALFPWLRLEEHGFTHLRLAAAGGALAVGVLFLLTPRRASAVLVAVPLAYFAIVHVPVESQLTLAAQNARVAGIGSARLDWIDRAVGPRAEVDVVWTGRRGPHVIWENEFFNRSVASIDDLGAPLPGYLPSTHVTIGGDRYLRDPSGRPLRARYVLTDGSLELTGTRRAVNASVGLSVWEIHGAVRSTSRVSGLYPNDTWSGPVVVYHRVHCAGGAVRVTMLGDASLFHKPQTVRSGSIVRRIAPGVPTQLTVPLTGCAARFVVSPTRIPGQGDTRRLGLRFLSFEWVARP